MGFIISTSQFVAKYNLTVNEFTTTDLLLYIDRYKDKILIELLGQELYDLWDADKNNPPYDKITNPFIWQSECGRVYQSQGAFDLSLSMIYFYYARDIIQKQTINGSVRNSNENSMGMTFTESMIWEKYNEMLITYEAIQAYVCEHKEDYPEFNGVIQHQIIPFF